MAFRKKMSRGKSKRSFSSNAFVNPKNMQSPMRGGFRI
ncbi:MAG: hypothetical protein [Microvirus sp.]|nr:MAG: hypothetical protein [Microvirus sp.]